MASWTSRPTGIPACPEVPYPLIFFIGDAFGKQERRSTKQLIHQHHASARRREGLGRRAKRPASQRDTPPTERIRPTPAARNIEQLDPLDPFRQCWVDQQMLADGFQTQEGATQE